MRFIRQNWIKLLISLYCSLLIFPLIIGKEFSYALNCSRNALSLPLCTIQGLYGVVGLTWELEKTVQLHGWDYIGGWGAAFLYWVAFIVLFGVVTILVFALTDSIKKKLNKQKVKK